MKHAATAATPRRTGVDNRAGCLREGLLQFICKLQRRDINSLDYAYNSNTSYWLGSKSHLVEVEIFSSETEGEAEVPADVAVERGSGSTVRPDTIHDPRNIEACAYVFLDVVAQTDTNRGNIDMLVD